MGKMISTIEPPKKPKEKPYIVYSGQKTIESYEKNGFELEDLLLTSVVAEPERFLSEVDPKKKPIRREITRIFRQKARQPDPKTGKMVSGEYITYEENWYGVDFMGVDIAPAASVIQGLWYEQEKKPRVEHDDHGRPRIVAYVRSGEHPRYDIPFSKKVVQEIFAKLDADPTMIKYYARFGSDPLLVAIRNGSFTYEQFVNCTWEELYKLLGRPGGPQGTTPSPPAAKLGDSVG